MAPVPFDSFDTIYSVSFHPHNECHRPRDRYQDQEMNNSTEASQRICT